MLDRTSYKIMKLLYGKSGIAEISVRKHFAKPREGLYYVNACEHLKKENYLMLGRQGDGETVYLLTPKGNTQYLAQKRKKVQFWVPIVVSNVIALASLILSIVTTIRLS